MRVKKQPVPKLTAKQQRQSQILSEIGICPSDLSLESVFKKSFERLDDSWQELDSIAFANIRLSDILIGKKRFVVQIEIDGDCWYIATHAVDAARLRAKHEGQRVISCASALSMFTSGTDDKSMNAEDFKNFFSVLSVFDAKVVDLNIKSV